MKNKSAIYGVTVLFLIIIFIIGIIIIRLLTMSGNLFSSPAQHLSATTTISSTTETAPFSNTTEEGYSLYTNNKYGFSIMYPTSLERLPSLYGEQDDLDMSDIFVGSIPKDTFKGTNLYEVKIIAGAKKTDSTTCLEMINGNSIYANNSFMKPEEVNIKGTVFKKITSGDAGAGNFYQTTRYSTYKNDICYELMSVAHSGNLGLLQETNPGIQQYDDSLYLPEFEEIVSFFKFTS